MDGISNALTRVFVLNPIAPKVSGGSFSTAKGQVGLFTQKGATLDGAKAIPNFDGKKNEEFFVEVGSGIKGNKGGLTTKSMRTPLFKPSQVKGIVFEEAKDSTVGKLILGYDGFDTNKTITLYSDAPSQISIQLSGEPVGYYGLSNAEINQSFTIVGRPDKDCTEAQCLVPVYDSVVAVVEEIKNRRLREGLTLGDLMDVKVVSSCVDNASSTGTAVFYNIAVTDEGDSNALAFVAGQYPGYEVTKVSRNGVVSNYQIYKTDGSGLPTAYTEYVTSLKTDCGASCPAGYTKTEGGFLYSVSAEDDGSNISATLLDAAAGISDVTGSIKTVTPGAAAALRTAGTYLAVTGTASASGIGATFNVVVNGSGAATATIVAKGSGYVVGETITIADASLGTGGAVALVLTITELAVKAKAVVKVGQDYGTGKYSILFDAALTDAEIDAIIASNAALKIDTTYVEVEDVCIKDTLATFTWTTGESCTVSEVKYTIDLEDTECGDSRLAELQKAYPNYTIVEEESPEPAHCRRRYSTMVLTNAVCDECNLDSYRTTAPDAFEFSKWVTTFTAEDTLDCKVGIEFIPKTFRHCPDKQFADVQATVNGQIEINVSGGELYGATQVGYAKNEAGAWAVTRTGRAFDGTGWGEDLLVLERISQHRETANFSGSSYIENQFKGIETHISPCKQYDTVSLTIDKNNLHSWSTGNTNLTYNYIFIIDKGTIGLYRDFFNGLVSGNPEANLI